ncbi:hypothetical protein TL16_g06222 [Triparma laevis f. inornata]|uniref:Uncharacterized protein n=2 Tax=Triparma laevis TaxID=1534972 RepID=A0A9W7KWZ1_9STRA|nr:hypothetical protein TL16_g06222 [Triparma laevis f. inornata]GMI14539.1 hypothetical protein TrLO_g4901 [Triparma laevis f. longispina]
MDELSSPPSPKRARIASDGPGDENTPMMSPTDSYKFDSSHLLMLKSLYSDELESGSLPTLPFDLIKEFLEGRATWANSLASSTPFFSVVGDSDSDSNSNEPTPQPSTAVMALRRCFLFIQEEKSKPKCLLELTAAVTSVIAATKQSLEARAEKYRQAMVEAQLSDQHPPLVYHDDELSLLSNRLMLWERLQTSVSCVKNM